jgi:predicted nucleic acid-binding protein
MVVDASVIVAMYRPDEVGHQRALVWFGSFGPESEPILAPSLLISEVASGLQRAFDDPDLILRAVSSLLADPRLRLVPVGNTLAFHAADVAARLGIFGCDAIYVALAQDRGERLISLDRRQIERARAVIEAQEP